MEIKRYDNFDKEYEMAKYFIGDSANSDEVKEYIIKKWQEEFGDQKPSGTHFAEFYHKLRTENIDGILIMNTLDELNINESKEEEKSVNNIVSDIKLNLKLVSTFGFGIGAFVPIVSSLMENMDISSIELSKQTIVLLTLTAISIIYIDEKAKGKEKDIMIKDSKSMLEELRMNGIGDGIVKKVINCLKSTKKIFNFFGRHIGSVIGNFMDMFAYTAIMFPIMNGLTRIIDKFDLNIDTMPQNITMLLTGFGTIIAKHGLIYLLKFIKNKLNINKETVEEIEKEIETPTIKKISSFGDAETSTEGDLIKED